MDVYHKILLNLYNVTGGKDSQSVDLKELVKSNCFLGSYEDIFQMLSGEGWIAETPKVNYVRITHWGVSEVKKSGNNESSSAQTAKKEALLLISDAKQFLIMLEDFASDASKGNFESVENKLSQITVAVGKLKRTFE